MIGTVAFSPLFAGPLLVALAAIFLGLLAFALYGGEWRGSALRAGTAGVLMVALLNPRMVEENREPLDDIAVIIVDQSQSQNLPPRPDQTEEALAGLTEVLARRDNLEVRVVRAGDDGEDGTRLIAALQDSLAQVPSDRLAGSVLITDGLVHDVARYRSRSGAPVHVLLTGRRQEVDRRLLTLRAPGYGLVGKNISLSYRIEDNGRTGPGDTARVQLRMDGELIEIADAVVGLDHTFDLTLRHAGTNVIEIKVAALDGELSLLNNLVVTTINGVRDRLKVMLISGLPHAGERTWRNLLKSDPSVDLVHFTILRPPEISDLTPINELALIMFPTQELFEEKLDEFDLIVFDRYLDRGVLPVIYHKNIEAYLLGGGAILFADGPEYSTVFSLFKSSLGTVMPLVPLGGVVERGFRPRVTRIGRRHPVTTDLNAGGGDGWGRWFRQIPVRARSGQVLMTGDGETPLLVLDRIGEGRVAQISSDHIWLWARGFEGGGPHAELVRRLAHWLMKEPELEEQRLSARVANGRLQIERHSLDATPVEVTVSAPSGAAWNVPLKSGTEDNGVATATFDVRETGLYRIDDGARTAFAASGPANPKEVQDLRSSADPLKPLLAATGGGLFRLQDGLPDVRFIRPGRKAAGKSWLGLIENNASALTGATEKPLLADLLLLLLVMAGLGATWWREGR